MKEKKKIILSLAFLVLGINCQAQDEDNNSSSDVSAGFFYNSGSGIDYTAFQLPTLDVLFDNAKSTPDMEILAKDIQLQKNLLAKQKWTGLNYISARGSYSYGIMDNYGSSSDVMTPIYYQYSGSKQSYWNIGLGLNLPLENIADYSRAIKRQSIQADKAKLTRDIAYNQLKQQIVTLYVRINNNLITLKTLGENAAAYKGAGALTDQEFKLGEASVRELAETRRWESSATLQYQTLQSSITTDILVLEIITNTPIITNIITDTTIEHKK